MNNIAICIPTYKRPLILEKLILSIAECNIDESLIKSINVIIIDNDIEKSAEPTILSLAAKKFAKFKLAYFNYPVKGLSNVRNELFRKAFELNPDFVVFVDDDEYVTPDWLNELLTTINNNNADAVRGPVLADIGHNVSKYIACWFERERFPNNTRLYSLTTGNLILRYTSLQKYDIWFDPRLNLSGSEDDYFGIQILKKGARLFWADNAITYEIIPENRTTLNWLLKRTFRTASTYSYFLILEKRYLIIIKKIILSVLYFFIGLFASVALLTPYKRKYWGLIKMAEGLGGLGGFFNITYQEYKKI
jgi:succinoglycan biosynthesis protein ExoM